MRLEDVKIMLGRFLKKNCGTYVDEDLNIFSGEE